MSSITRTYNPNTVEQIVLHRFETLPDELKNSPKALVDWAITNTLQQVAYAELNLERNLQLYDPDKVAEEHPYMTGHAVIDLVRSSAGA